MERDNIKPIVGWRLETGVYNWFMPGFYVLWAPKVWMAVGIVLIALLACVATLLICRGRQQLQAHSTALRVFAGVRHLQLDENTLPVGAPTGYIGSLGSFYRNGVIRICGSINLDGLLYREAACSVMPLLPGSGLLYRLAVEHYGFMIVNLEDGAVLPNIFFTNRPSKLRLHRIYFLSNRRIFMGRKLEHYFKAYSPIVDQDYSALRQPGVLQAFIRAADYDIEIKAGKLYLYGKLADPERQIPDMQDKIIAIREALHSETGEAGNEGVIRSV